ncbi:hypothetical protein, partial [Scardovia wiggsiae]|uniref:hypothetical protein n=1 Tax=Scardovia wiggsiae TaxID=230143 RepID=UPI00374EFCAF
FSNHTRQSEAFTSKALISSDSEDFNAPIRILMIYLSPMPGIPGNLILHLQKFITYSSSSKRL